MRLFLTAVILTLLAQPALSMTNEGLLQSCKPFANRGFEYANQNDPIGIFKDGLCLGYMYGAIEQMAYLCESYDKAVELFPGGEAAQIRLDGYAIIAEHHATSATGHNVNAVIQAFINHAEKNPESWENWPDASRWLVPLFPCKE